VTRSDSGARGVLFDLDGTLIHTAPEFIHIGLQLREEAGLPPISDDEIWRSVSDGALGMVQAALEISSTDPAFEKWRQRFLTLYEAGLGQLSDPYPGLTALIARLHQMAVRWGVVTNKLERFARPLMAQMPFSPPPHALITPDHVTLPKPDPESVLLACRQLDCAPSETLFIGDHLRDIEAGRAAGCRTIAAAYGYLAQGESATQWQADRVVHSSTELAAVIEEMLS
jgi:N-acetyl-D-muramate 6-phosphate phosphatase